MGFNPFWLLKFNNRTFFFKFLKEFHFIPFNPELYKQAFRHKSVSKIYHHNNERLEFLGDAVLSLIISELAFIHYPSLKEGMLTQLRSKLVNRSVLNEIAHLTGITRFIEVDRNFNKSGIATTDLPGNALEAFIGAVYLDRGYRFARRYVLKRVVQRFLNIEEIKDVESNFKGRLIEIAQKKLLELDFISTENGSKAEPSYHVKILLNDEIIGEGEASRKKVAQQKASKEALQRMGYL